MHPMIVWLVFVTVIFSTGKGPVERAEFVAGGHSAEDCEEVRDSVLQFGKTVGALGGLKVKRIEATDCTPMDIQIAEEL